MFSLEGRTRDKVPENSGYYKTVSLETSIEFGAHDNKVLGISAASINFLSRVLSGAAHIR